MSTILTRVARMGLCLVALLGGAMAGSPRAEEAPKPPSVPPAQQPLRLFNGRDLGGLYTWLKDTKYEDPRGVFSVADGMLRVSGDGFGGIATKEAYRDYHLILEYKWGKQTWEPRKNRARDSGLLIHCNGPDGGFQGTWMESFEVQIIEGGTGDLLVVKGDGKVPLRLVAQMGRDRDGERIWTPNGPQETLETFGRVNWRDRDPDWKDVLGFRGKKDVEHPDDWNRLEVACQGSHVAIRLNGVLVSEALSVSPAAGKLCLQSEGAEIFIRRWELRGQGTGHQTGTGNTSAD